MQQTVLLIDDSLPIHKLVRAHLEADRLSVVSAYDAETGLSAAKLIPSLILVDLDMPDLDGFEVCRRLKADPATSAIPVIFLTANGGLDDKVKGLELGALDYISKPFKPRELRARVRSSLRTKHQMDAMTMVDGLTGLWNRTYFDLHLNSYVSQTKRNGSPLACVILEADPISEFKTAHSAQALNNALKKIGRVLLSQIRTEDIICRFDETKFVILAMGANRAAAVLMVERLRSEIERQVHNETTDKAKIICNFGIADTHVADESGDATLFDRADAAVRRARKSSTGRVEVAKAIEEKAQAA